MRVDEIEAGLWRWTGLHPDWTPAEGGPEGWEQEVGCVYFEAPDAVVLIDPLIPPEDRDRFLTALDRDIERIGRPVAIALTVEWHGRSAPELVERYGGRVVAGSGDLPDDVVGIPVESADETLYWIESGGALVAGDVLLGADGGVRLCPDSWLSGRADPQELRALLLERLDLPIERVLVSHGEPVLASGRDALARALRS
jgi:glyoxylase-like metal-dependent hydrolase (beta-lactamase superfamily II)